jgi:hypothetical protein
MRRLKKLGEAVKAISPQAEIRFRGIPDREDWWVCIVAVGDAILVESAAGPLETVLDETAKKVRKMSSRIRAVLPSMPGDSIPPPPPEDPDPDSERSV